MADCVFLLTISGDTKSESVSARFAVHPSPSRFATPDDVPVAYEMGLRLMHVILLLPDEGFARKLEALLAPYPVPESLKIFRFAEDEDPLLPTSSQTS